MTATERSKRRDARFGAATAASELLSQRLGTLHGELRAAGLPEWASKVAEISRSAALRAAAEYARRNAGFYATNGARMHTPEERAQHIQHIVALADQVDALADIAGSLAYPQFQAILDDMHKAGFWPETSLVSEVARTIHLASTSA
jgi:hypothetical protein